MLRLAFKSAVGSKLWYRLRFVARPILDCRMLQFIATKYPQFRDPRISPIPPRLTKSISPKWQIDIFEAWAQLTGKAPSSSEAKTLSVFREQFNQDLATSYSLHAEIQLFMYYEDSLCAAPAHPYFGCSKKTCLLCATFLQALPAPISTRGRHGVCYPAWGIPWSKSAGSKTALRLMEKALVVRIKNFMDSPAQIRKAFFEPAAPQSSFVSDFPSQDQLQRGKRLTSPRETEIKRANNRLIL